MVGKTERFEMRVEEEILDRVDEWREKNGAGLSRAEAMRQLIEAGLARGKRDVVIFSDGEKLILLMLRDLFKQLKVRSDIDPEFISEVIWGGHYWAPKWELAGVFHGHEDDPRHLDLVLDVLEMWESIERGFEKLDKKEKDRVQVEAEPFGKNVKFPGFDGNGESTYLGIAHFLVNKMERFTRFSGREMNSHCPSLDMHKRLLRVFAPMKETRGFGELTAPQIITLLKAKRFPDG